MAQLEAEIRHAFERRLASMPARPDLRARISDAVGQQSSRTQIWRVAAASAALLLVGAVALFALLARHIPPAPIIGPTPTPSVASPTATATATVSSVPRPGVPGTPGPRLGASMAWDKKDGYLVMFGGARYGASGNVPYNDTWVWAGDTWRQLKPPTSPPGRTFPAMAFDERSQRLLAFGGGAANSDPFRNDTWAWDGTTWTELHPTTTPPACGEARMVYDPELPGIVLVFQPCAGDAAYATTWTWTGTNWLQLKPTTNVTRRGEFGLVHFTNLGDVLVGGEFGPPPDGNRDDVWTFKGGTWTQLRQATRPVAGPCVIAFDADSGVVVLLPLGIQQTWTWDGANWTLQKPAHSPPILAFPAIGYDPASGQVVLFGGKTDSLRGSPVLDQTWIWNGNDWQKR
jgi:hypothetical protein